MTFATALGLLVALLVTGPLAAHLLFRRKTEIRDFPAARLVASAIPIAKKRARLEDRALFAQRALAVLALAVLGASPFIRCSRLSVARRGGGSLGLVLVVDDSMSMRAMEGSSTRLATAKKGALEILASTQEGDSVAIVAAGAPARVVLAASTNIEAARHAIERMSESDRGTDLDGALALASGIARATPQTDRRVVLLSDLADGKPTAAPLGEAMEVPLWLATPTLGKRAPDCGIVRADRQGRSLRARVVCGEPDDATGRFIEVVSAVGEVGAREPLSQQREQDITLVLASTSAEAASVRLSGGDAIASDDSAPIVPEGGPLTAAVVSDLTTSGVVTGGASPLEQAIAALEDGTAIRPVPAIPDSPEELGNYAAIFLDDPAGLTPEARVAFRQWLEKGGVAVTFLGPHAAGAILGSGFEPLLPGVVRWSGLPSDVKGVLPSSAVELGSSVASLGNLHAKGRAVLDVRAGEGATPIARWSDGAPLVQRQSVGRGISWVVTLPANVEMSDLPIRPAFLELIDLTLSSARARGAQRRTVVGTAWPLGLGDEAITEVTGPAGPLVRRDDISGGAFVPERIGVYHVRRGADAEVRVAEAIADEVNLTPRRIVPGEEQSQGSTRASIDASPYVAIALLLVLAGEALTRMLLVRR